MKLGLGLSIPGIAAMGGKQVQRLYSEAVFRLDARFNPDQATGVPTDLSSSGLSVTVNGTPTWTAGKFWTFNGTSDWFETADNDLLDFSGSDSFTAVIAYRKPNNATSATLFAKRAVRDLSASVGWSALDNNSAAYTAVSDATTGRYPLRSATPGQINVVASVHTPSSTATWVNGTSGTASTTAIAGTLSNSLAFRIARASTAAQYGAFDLLGFLLIRRSLSSTELSVIAADGWAV